MYKMTKKNTKKTPKRPYAKIALVIALVVAGVAALELSNTTHVFHKPTAESGSIPTINTPDELPSNNSVQPDGASSEAPEPPLSDKQPVTSQNSIPAPSSGEPPATPYGTFVSNHMPSLSGRTSPSQVQSVCSTTPGATCKIEFKKDGVVKTLDAQTVGGNGATYWTWDVKKAGLIEGKWEIVVTAALNGQTASSTDGLPLEVQP